MANDYNILHGRDTTTNDSSCMEDAMKVVFLHQLLSITLSREFQNTTGKKELNEHVRSELHDTIGKSIVVADGGLIPNVHRSDSPQSSQIARADDNVKIAEDAVGHTATAMSDSLTKQSCDVPTNSSISHSQSHANSNGMPMRRDNTETLFLA